MKLPQTFVPERDTTDKIKEYMGVSISERISQLHEDPNLGYVMSYAIIQSRISNPPKPTLIELIKLTSGETSGDLKGTGIPTKDIIRTIQELIKISETRNRKCVYAGDFLEVSEDLLFGYIDPKKLGDTKKVYLERIKVDIADACFEEPSAIKKGVMDYVQMARAMFLTYLEHGDVWKYKDPQTHTLKSITLKGRYVFAVEERLGHNTEKQKEEFRKEIDRYYSQQTMGNPGYDFMDNPGLVRAVIDVKLESDIIGTRSLTEALTSRISEDERQFYSKVINHMIKHSNYCKSCAEKTIEYFCTPR